MKQSRRYEGPKNAQTLFLTLDDLLLLKKALLPLELLITTSSKSLPNIQLAQQTVTQIQGKVAYMAQQQVCGDSLAFDANEVIILQTAVRLLVVQQLSDSPDTYETLKQCLLLQSRLALIIARTRKGP